MWLCVCVCMCAYIHIQRSDNNLQESVLSNPSGQARQKMALAATGNPITLTVYWLQISVRFKHFHIQNQMQTV